MNISSIFSILTTTTTRSGVGSTNFNCTTQLEGVIAIAGFVLKVIQYAAPIILIIWGSIDLIRAITAGKEEEIKKKQGILIKRAIAAVILFFVPLLVSTLLGLIGSTDWRSCWNANKDKPLPTAGEVPN